MKQRYYRLQKLLKTNSQYCILLGERSNGKSYAVKEHVLMDYKNTGHQFIYLRRFELETKANAVEEYFADMPIESMFDGKYNFISVYRGTIYLSVLNHETNKIERYEKIGFCHYLSGATHFKSRMYPNVYSIIYEEFISNDIYISQEPDKLLDYVSTVLRRRNGQIFMIGNTISRICPYFTEWSLSKIPKMEQGQIDIYELDSGQVDDTGQSISVKIAVELCENSGRGSAMFFGKSAETINNGAWKSDRQPHLKLPYDNYTKVYEFTVSHLGFSFICQLLCANSCAILYVYPNSHKRYIRRQITKEYAENFFITPKLNENIKPEAIAKKCLSNNKVAFCDNLTGTEFLQILREMGGI